MLLDKDDGTTVRTAVRAGDFIWVDWKNQLMKFFRDDGDLTWRNGDDKSLMRDVLGLDRIAAEVIIGDMLDLAGLRLSVEKVRDEPSWTMWKLEAHEPSEVAE